MCSILSLAFCRALPWRVNGQLKRNRVPLFAYRKKTEKKKHIRSIKFIKMEDNQMNKEMLIEMAMEDGKAEAVISEGYSVRLRMGLGAVFVTIKEKGRPDRCDFVPYEKNKTKSIAKAIKMAEAMMS